VLAEAKLIQNFRRRRPSRRRSRTASVRALNNSEWAAVPFNDNEPFQFPNDGKDWGAFKNRRLKYAGGRARPKSEREIEIQKKLRTPVSLQFTQAPFGAGHTTWPSWRKSTCTSIRPAWPKRGVTRDTPVTVNLPSEIMLKSAFEPDPRNRCI